jgi:hypothetical protein
MQRSPDIQLLPFPPRTSLLGVLHHVEPVRLQVWLVQSFYLVIVELYQVIPNLLGIQLQNLTVAALARWKPSAASGQRPHACAP